MKNRELGINITTTLQTTYSLLFYAVTSKGHSTVFY